MKASEANKISKSIDVPEIALREVLKEIELMAQKGSYSLVIKKDKIKDIEHRLLEYGYTIYQYKSGPYARYHKVISWENPRI